MRAVLQQLQLLPAAIAAHAAYLSHSAHSTAHERDCNGRSRVVIAATFNTTGRISEISADENIPSEDDRDSLWD